MNAEQLLLTRQSTPRLTTPAPTEIQLKFILDSAVRVPDHAGLCPWEFIIAQEAGLDKLAAAFVNAAEKSGESDEMVAKSAKMPFRAPMVITVVAKYQHHPKVPIIEQSIAAGCATMAMQQAAFALGLGGVWRTGDFAFNRDVKSALGIKESDDIVGFLYIGTPMVKAPIKPSKSGNDFARFL
ncbi:NAD(P)H nitroreductase [Parashewanella spongiae]|uniref:Putative NAD(P)H nitroreductase n=1 Tax=Parashewanella spongiae TaxID=342950 RepID=A0A3A6UCE1_9GAMM|nr:NAD(P)H nitroreductase [Parashewanella spongiae]MCL1077899.1 NAD(P)H nitroreductase [Parashewanella spongiae]RJY14945.1 NAD(P)H nitroreductase [Parashewanella spongiae]